MKIEPGHVYVIPPNKDMSLLHGRLHLLPVISPRGLHLPIDFFFRALAEDQGERSVGVILSGMGSDGTLGLGAIKEKGGATFVQASTSAKFDGMPRSAIDAGLADVVAPVEELPGRILAFLAHTPYAGQRDGSSGEKLHSALDKVFVLLRTRTGNDFSLYKQSTIYRRIERRMALHQITSIASYIRFLRENPDEIDRLFKELLIGVTSFFRDPAEWERLKQDVMPALLSSRSTVGGVRCWVAGCSTGEEAYSLAMVFKEAMEPLNSTEIATLFLDVDLRVRRFTTPTAKIIKLIPGDLGRPITDIASDLDYSDLAGDAREVLRTLVLQEKQVATRDGRWFVVRILPYRTLDNVIDGVVFTFTDASAAHALEIALREQASQLRQMAEALPNLVWGARPDGAFDYLSR